MNELWVYIASPIIRRTLNEEIAKELDENNIAHFLPHTMKLPDEQAKLMAIGDRCFEEIDKATIIIAVSPFGLSTASEIGYAINRKRRGENIKIILFDSNPTEVKRLDATLTPYFDKIIQELSTLTEEIFKLEKS